MSVSRQTGEVLRDQSSIDSIYMDHAATTPMAPAVLEAMMPYLKDRFGNPSSIHRLGRAARGIIEESRKRIALHLSAEPEQIIFTSGATEANNLALNLLSSGGHLITSTTEHKAVLKPADALEIRGAEVSYLSPDRKSGTLSEREVRNALRPHTRLVSIMYVNNETGVLAPIQEIASVCGDHGVRTHTDAAQAAAWLPLNTEYLKVDLMSLSAHKIYGPKGIGILYVKEGIELTPLIIGGSQERGRRGGTENVAAAVGMATAMDLIAANQEANTARVRSLRDELQTRLLSLIGDQLIVNTPSNSAPHILNVAFKPVDEIPVDGEMLLLNMDLEGVCASAGSACTSGALTPSHVLIELGVPEHTARASLRLSLGLSTTKVDIEKTALRIHKVIKRMREQRQYEG